MKHMVPWYSSDSGKKREKRNVSESFSLFFNLQRKKEQLHFFSFLKIRFFHTNWKHSIFWMTEMEQCARIFWISVSISRLSMEESTSSHGPRATQPLKHKQPTFLHIVHGRRHVFQCNLVYPLTNRTAELIEQKYKVTTVVVIVQLWD